MISLNSDVEKEIYEASIVIDRFWNTWNPERTYKWQTITVDKMGQMAEELADIHGDNFDFVDYWYNWFLSPIKDEIDKDLMLGINALWISTWRKRFERTYTVIIGDALHAEERYWFGSYMEGLVFAFRCSPKVIGEYYGISTFRELAFGYPMYHCMGYDAFVKRVVKYYGKPDCVNKIEALHL